MPKRKVIRRNQAPEWYFRYQRKTDSYLLGMTGIGVETPSPAKWKREDFDVKEIGIQTTPKRFYKRKTGNSKGVQWDIFGVTSVQYYTIPFGDQIQYGQHV